MALRRDDTILADMACASWALKPAGMSSSGSAWKSRERAGARYRKSTRAFSGVAIGAPCGPAGSKPKKNDGVTWWMETVPRGVLKRRVLASETAYVTAGICEIMPCRYSALCRET